MGRNNQNWDNGQNNRGPNYNRQQRRHDNGNQRGGNVRDSYPANRGKATENDRREKDTDPHLTGVGNVELPDGSRLTMFINVWENEDGSLGFVFKDVNAPRGGNQRRGYGQSRQQGNYQRRQNGYGGSYYEQQDDNQQRQQNGAMSRARPIPPTQYNNGPYNEMSPPPASDYPDGPNYPDEEAPY